MREVFSFHLPVGSKDDTEVFGLLHKHFFPLCRLSSHSKPVMRQNSLLSDLPQFSIHDFNF